MLVFGSVGFHPYSLRHLAFPLRDAALREEGVPLDTQKQVGHFKQLLSSEQTVPLRLLQLKSKGFCFLSMYNLIYKNFIVLIGLYVKF